MSDEELHRLLARLHESLNSSATIDAQTRQMLTTVMQDIDVRLNGNVTLMPEGPPAGRSAAGPRLEEAAVRFEAGHPGLAQLLRQLAALLGQAGI